VSDEGRKYWPITRTWAVRSKNSERDIATTDELSNVPVCFLLGSAGLGKTYETGRLAEIDRACGRNPIVVRLAELAQSATELGTRLEGLSKRLTAETVVYLNALDEIMLPVPSAAVVVGRWIRESLLPTGAWLRISCRSAVWPAILQTELHRIYPDAVTAILQPLSLRDIEIAAASEHLDGKAFLNAVKDASAESLAEQPLTLKVLLRIQCDEGILPNRRVDLFNRGVEILSREREDRVEAGAPAPDVPRLIDAAERLACFALLSGLETMAVEERAHTLSISELANLPRGGVDESLVRTLTRSALVDSNEPRQFRFAHRQFVEFLAGRRIASLLPHQVKALLASGLGWRSGVPGPLRETAAFAAMHSDAVADWLAECDPEVIGLSDVADDGLRRRATLNLLELFQRHALTAVQIWRTDLDVNGFRYAGAEDDLRPVLRERGPGAEDVLECALKLIADWQLVTMSEDLADLALDPTALGGVLDLLDNIPDDRLDNELIDAVTTHRVPEDRISRTAEFVLRRTGEAGLAAFATLVTGDTSGNLDAVAIRAAAALMTHVTRDGWEHVQAFLRSRPDLTRKVLEEGFHRERFLFSTAGERTGPASMAPEQLGELLCLLLETFPPENDPQHDDAHWVSPDDSARTERSQLISWLSEQQTPEAVATLRYVEQGLGDRYPWLRSARVTSERRFRLAQWRPLEPKTLVEILDAREKRLIRSDVDALDAVVEAIDSYARRLRQDRLGDLDDFWNRPNRGRPTPKDEQRASEKVCGAVRDYLREYAVTADREVQIVRRLTPAKAGGAPGSRPDVLCRVPASGTVTDAPIAVPLEVKLSFNPQARSGLQDQLAGRYIPQVAATGGVFVLVWMDAPRLSAAYRPLWPGLADARQDLGRLAEEENAKAGGTTEVRVAFIDASLPAAGSPARSRERKGPKTVSGTRTRPQTRKAPKTSRRAGKTHAPTSETKRRNRPGVSPKTRRRSTRGRKRTR
jgi:hypothetical protein